MFRKMKDWVKDLPLGVGGEDQEQQQQQQHAQIQQQQQSAATASNTSSPKYTSPGSISSPPSRNTSIDSGLSSATTAADRSNNNSNNNNNNIYSLIKSEEIKDIWSVMTGSEVDTVRSSSNTQKLKALWTDFQSSKSDKDKILKLNKLLPHFISLYEDKKIDVKNMLNDIFGNNSKAFSFAVSRRLVKDLNEIWKKHSTAASAQQAAAGSATNPKEAVAKEIYGFLSTTGGLVCGFELLYAIEILCESPQSCEAMSEASVPSALVRCLQAMFNVPVGILESHKGIIQDKLIKSLCYLSRQKAAIEELQKTDTLSALFSLMSHNCAPTHRSLRAQIGSFGHELTDLHPPTITYINSKKVIPSMIADLNNYYNYTPETYISLCKIIIKILSESSKKSAILLDDFLKINGYSFFVESLFRLESSKDKPHLFDLLLDAICSLIYVGYGHISVPVLDQSPVPYQSAIQNLKDLSNQSNISKNEHAFIILERYFLKSTYEENRIKILDRILTVFSSNPANFILLQHCNTITKFIQEYESLNNNLKHHVMKIVCFVVTVLSCVPFQELSTFSLLVNENPSQFTLEMVLQLITTLVNFEFRYKHIFRESGLLDILVKVIDTFSQDVIRLNNKYVNRNNNSNNSNSKNNNNQPQEDEEELFESNIQVKSLEILLDCLYLLISEHPDNIALVRSFSLFNILLHFLPYNSVRGKCLRILQQLIKYDNDPSQREFDGLIKVLTSLNKDNYSMKTDILNSIRKLFLMSKHSTDSFREHGGFVSIISILIALESSFSAEKISAMKGKSQIFDQLELIEAICRTTTAALSGNVLNRESFEQQIGYSTFASCLIMTNVLSTEYANSVVGYIFDMVTENLSGGDYHLSLSSSKAANSSSTALTSTQQQNSIINNVEAFNIILDIIPHVSEHDFVLAIIRRINRMAEFGRFNQEALSKLSIPDWVLQKFPSNLSNAKDPLQPLLLNLIQTVGANCLSGSELRQFVKLLQPENSPQVLLKILSSMAKSPPSPPYFEFNITKNPHAYIRLPIQDRTWPPTNGYTIMFWLYIEKASTQNVVDLVHIYSDDKKSALYIFIKNGFLYVHITNNSKYVIEVQSFKFTESKWYHIGIVHARRLLSGTDFKLFVDGFLKYTATKAQYPAQITSGTGLFCDIGTSSMNRFPVEQIWRIGPFYLLEESLSAKHINTIYFLGPNYVGNFKGRFSPYQTYEIVNSQNLLAIKDLDYGDQLGPLNLAKVSMSIDENRIVVGLCASNKIIRTNNSPKIVYNEILNHILNDISQANGSTPTMMSSNSSPTTNSGGSLKKKEKDFRVEIINQSDLTTKQRGVLSGSVEAFRRNKVADSIKKIGGMPIALLLLEKSNNVATLHDSLSLLVGLIQYHPTNTHEMSLINGYELLAWVLKKKVDLFNIDIIDLLFDFIGINTHLTRNRSEGTVANWNACKYIMMNYEIWKNTSVQLQKYILDGYNSLIMGNVQKKFNIDSLRKIHLIQELFDILSDESVPEEVASETVITVLYNVLSEGGLIEDDIRQVSAFLIAGLHQGQQQQTSSKRKSTTGKSKHTTVIADNSTRTNRLVNRVFYIFLQVCANCQDPAIIFRRVSSFWCFYFIDDIHPPLTVSLALRVTSVFFLLKYEYCASFIKKSGFKLLEKIVPALSGYQEFYIIFLHLLLGSDPKSLLDISLQSPTLEFHELLSMFKPVEKNLFCIESAQLMLAMVKKSYEDNYKLYQKQQQERDISASSNNNASNNANNDNEEFLSSLMSASSLNQSSNSTSPLSFSQGISPSASNSSISSLANSNASVGNQSINTTTTTTTSVSNPNTPSSVFSRVGSFLSKVEEKTTGFVAGALEEVSDGQVQISTKKKRASVSITSSSLNNGNTNSIGNLPTSGSNSNLMNLFLANGSTDNADNSGNANNDGNNNNNVNNNSFLYLSNFASPEGATSLQHTILTYFIYLFHENHHFQQECFSYTIVEYLISILFPKNKIHLPPISTVALGTISSGSIGALGGSNPLVKDRVLDLVLKFLCQIMLSALRKTSKAIGIVEMILEGTPHTISDDDFVLYHTRIIIELMVVIETNITKSEYYDNERVHSNINKLCSMLVDRIQLDLLVRSHKTLISRRLFFFIVKVLEKFEADRMSSKSAQPLYSSLNRAILYLFNNLADSPVELGHIINHIINHQRIIFSDNNIDLEYYQTLCYLNYKSITSDQQESVDNGLKMFKLLLSLKGSNYFEMMATTLQLKVPSATNPRGTEIIDLKSGFEMVASSNFKEFRVWLSDNLAQVTQVFEESPKRAYSNQIGSEKKNANEHTFVNMKSRRKERLVRMDRSERKEFLHEEEKFNHITKKAQYFVAVDQERKKKIRQLENDKQKFNAIQWENMRAQLTRERAVWGPSEPSPLDKWKMDSTEGPYRMRKKMEKNYSFYKDYPYIPPSFDENNNSLPIPCSGDSETFMNLVGTELEYSLDPSYWKYDLISTNQVITSSTNVNSNVVNNNNISNNTTNTTITVSTPLKSNNDSSPLAKSSTGDITPPQSPIQSSSEDHQSLSMMKREYSKDSLLESEEAAINSMKESELFGSVQDETSVGGQQQQTPSSSSTPQTPSIIPTTPSSQQPNIPTTPGGSNNNNPSSNPQNEVDEEPNNNNTNEDETQAFIRLLDPSDQKQLREEMRRDPRLPYTMFNVGSVEGMDKIEGILIFCNNYMYIFDGYSKDPANGEISEVEEKINSEWLPEGTVLPQKKKIIHHFIKWSYDDIRDVLKRRYLLRQVALEIFSTDGRNNLIVFKDEPTRDEVHNNLLRHLADNNYTIGGDASGISGSQTGVDEQDLGVRDRLTSIWRKSPLTTKWQQGQISNFQYLMHLNTLAGRSYNDLTQYPVFPWVLVDYESDYLDLDDPKVYRDLSKPMGALKEPRAQKFRERFENWDDQEPNEHGHKVPKFHYGTHYSSAAIVLYYLIRLEPFTQHFLKLQGGRWDQPDRLFSAIEEAWGNSSCGSTGVVMELIPEFYYLPEFLGNSNKFNFGTKQGGESIDDVALPKWAKGSPEEFIRLHRKALESDYVSEHLHEWIDLIFGYKQQGKAAEDALNVFYYLTYEGAVNIDAITDPVEKAATIAQINNFGQTPKQLFDKPHPKRNQNLNQFPFYAKPLVGNFIKDINEPVGQIRILNDRATCVGFNKVLLPPSWTKYVLWGLPDGSIRYQNGDKIKVLEDHHDGPLTCMTSTEDGRICVSGGTDSLICVYNINNRFSLAKRLVGHTAPITCVVASRPYSVIVSGSDDSTCIIWDLNRLTYVRSLVGHEGPISCVCIHDTTGEIVTCSGTTISIYSINGVRILSHKTSQITSHDQITCCIWSKGPEWLGENVLLTGHRDGKIKVWGIESRLVQSETNKDQMVYKNIIVLRSTFYNQSAHNSAITSIHLTNDQSKLYSGDIEGRVVMWSEEPTPVKQRGWTLGGGK
ncbi:hypothetical protein CYY_007734 [Polysphondylium violaceum]|uniref:BEACH domain-containing protein n=1 Tax=Polysphondylium violaceum TaxID=133409 RepID=A0A8J4PPB3_9MYCE|nr:hypothetical protein CYY_007734 [Polysphondylium violaceum]